MAISVFPSIGGNGRYIAFQSSATNLVKDDTNKRLDIFVHDRESGTTRRVSVNSQGEQASFSENSPLSSDTLGSLYPSMSGNGRYVAFTSDADNLVRGDTNHQPDTFVRDLKKRKTFRVSVNPNGSQNLERQSGYRPSISSSGRFVAFTWSPNDITSCCLAYPADRGNVYVRDTIKKTTEIVSVSSDGTRGDLPNILSPFSERSISGDGRYVTFMSDSHNLIPDDSNQCCLGSAPPRTFTDVYVRDRRADRTERVSISSDGSRQGDGHSGWHGAAISRDGRFVTFSSLASTLTESVDEGTGECNNGSLGEETCDEDVFAYDRATGAMERISLSPDGKEPRCELITHWALNGCSSGIPTTWDGRFIAFVSIADNFVDGDSNQADDVFVRDRGRLLGAQPGRQNGEPPPQPVDPICLPIVGCLPPLPAVAVADRGPHDSATIAEADLVSARIAYRRSLEDVFVRLDVRGMDPLAASGVARGYGTVSPVLYGIKLSVDSVRYEVRVQGTRLDPSGGLTPSFALFRCSNGGCQRMAGLKGGFGSVTDGVVVSIPLRLLRLHDGGDIQGAQAFTAIGTTELGPVQVLDRLAFTR